VGVSAKLFSARLAQNLHQHSKHPLAALHDISIGEPQYPITTLGEMGRSLRVVRHTGLGIMRVAIDFDDELSALADKSTT
jgi:hypothetical protein